jgi:hypothetical protein
MRVQFSLSPQIVFYKPKNLNIMNLTLFFRLIVMSIFSARGGSNYSKSDYDHTFFFCPEVWAKDGFHVSLQIHNGNYCSSENGYRTLGHTMQDVEFGFPSENESMMFKYSEMWNNDVINFDVTNTVGKIPVSIIEEVFIKHEGIDWEKTISIDTFIRFFK